MAFIADVPGVGPAEFTDENEARSYFEKIHGKPSSWQGSAIPSKQGPIQKDQNPKAQDSLGSDALKSVLGLASGLRLPGTDLASAAVRTGIEDLKSRIQNNGKPMMPGELLDFFKQKYDQFGKTNEELQKDAPVSSAIGSGVRNIAEYGTGMKALSGLSSASPAVNLLATLAKGGALNAAIGQQDKADPSRLVSDMVFGAGGELAGAGISKIAEKMSGLPSWLYNKAVKTPLKEVKAGKSNLADELLARGVWGTKQGLLEQAETGLETQGDKLDQLLQGAGSIKRGHIPDELSKLQDYYNSTPGYSREAKQVERAMKDFWKNPDFVDISASDANQMKKNLYDLNQKAYQSINTQPVKTEINKAIARGLKDSIEEVAPEAKGINKELAVNLRLKQAMTDALAKGQSASPAGLKDLLTGSVAAEAFGAGGIAPAVITEKLLGSTLAKTGGAVGIKKILDFMEKSGLGARYLAPMVAGQ